VRLHLGPIWRRYAQDDADLQLHLAGAGLQPGPVVVERGPCLLKRGRYARGFVAVLADLLGQFPGLAPAACLGLDCGDGTNPGGPVDRDPEVIEVG
jgi:hypothetical protein